MFQFVNRYRRTTLVLLGLSIALLISAFASAFPGSGNGRWVQTSDFRCSDSELYCVVWEFSPGDDLEDEEGPCCVTQTDYFLNQPTCTSFRLESN